MEAPKILVVDDDPAIVAVVGAILNRYDHKVLPACDPRQALEIVRSGELVDVVITDFCMPVLSGSALIREIARISPSTTGIIVTADTLNEAEVPSSVPVLKKPFTTRDLLATVNAMLLRSARLRARMRTEIQRSVKLREDTKRLHSEVRKLCSQVGDAVQALSDSLKRP